MRDGQFFVLPKVVGLIIDTRTGEVAGVIDGHGILPREVMSTLSEVFGQAVNAAMLEEEEEDLAAELAEGSERLEEDRKILEQMYLLPAQDVEGRIGHPGRENLGGV